MENKREIKFRFLRCGQLVYEYDGFRENIGINEALNYIQTAHGDQYSVMQWSGLKDRNGKDIYEGDIIKYDLPAENDMQEDNVEYIEEVKFIDGCFECDNIPLYAPAKDFGCEVIGNIYQNPELLK